MVDLKIQLPDDFLEEEVRCGYLVSKKMKEVWAVELDLLAEFDRVCKKHGIKYFASGGTMLGAVRHKGFIPWDDDIDLMMMRDDYTNLCNIAEKEFRHPFFFQTNKTDFGSIHGYARLRNSMTTGILTKYSGLKTNQGIFIDIFPLDVVVDDDDAFKKQGDLAQKYKERAYFFSGFVPSTFYSGKNMYLTIAKRIIGHILSPLFVELSNYNDCKFEKTCQRYNYMKDPQRISTLSFMFNEIQHIKYSTDYKDLIDMDFEFLKIPVGKEYDHALQVRYGNYMEYVRGGSIHGDIFFDTDHSYLDYINNKFCMN